MKKRGKNRLLQVHPNFLYSLTKGTRITGKMLENYGDS